MRGTDNQWYMSSDEQIISMLIALAVIAAIALGLLTLWKEWRKQWEIDDFADEVTAENADVVEIEIEHPAIMPRRPKRLGPRGWHA